MGMDVVWLYLIGIVAFVGLLVYVAVSREARRQLGAALPDVAEALGDTQTAEKLRQRAAQPAAPSPPTQQPELPSAPLALRTWLDKVNHTPDKNPHLCVIGPSGSGKTTITLAVLGDRPGQFVICTPKNADDDPWGGFPAVRSQVDGERISFDTIKAAAKAVFLEMLRRNTEGLRGVEPLTLVLDDYGFLIAEIPELAGWVLQIVALGRSTRIRVVIISTETNVKAWGWEGRSEARDSCIWLDCEEETRRAFLSRWRKPQQEVDTRHVYQLAQRAQLAARVWPGIQLVPGPASDYPVSMVSPPTVERTPARRVGYGSLRLAELEALKPGTVAVAERQSTRVPEHLLGRESGAIVAEQGALAALEASQSTPAEQFDLDTLEGHVAFLVAQGWSANRIVNRLKGDNNRIYALVRELKAGQNL
jgi:energy-coupling factor transporter ATP-binding protein EcfA2